ncbi:MAG: tRNA (N(6)-L-threonylcarbamoyladenosine(37)-C(2))-methylthiotransferase MtaB, partial [Oscillospiraceae bacterium]|nr:tRNA (N(6)-L-threonylcarbamoyladenosine(37)-C(2))-methylthiotransferase MtaB [Oscillospiraceae bacterium]
MTVATVTLGCKVNQVDSEALRARLLGAGFVDAAPEKADVVVVNSCAVTAESERKTRQKLRQCRALNPDCILVLTGCAAQVSANAAEEYPEADIVLGHIDSGDLARYIDKFMSSQGKSINVSAHYIGEPFAESAFFRESARTRASIKIEDGCDRFCSYCIIPRARGHVRSKPLAAVRQEAETLAQQGFREVVLVGINLAAYGTDIGCDLADAVALMDECSGIQRVRLGSLEPDLLTDKL